MRSTDCTQGNRDSNHLRMQESKTYNKRNEKERGKMKEVNEGMITILRQEYAYNNNSYTINY